MSDKKRGITKEERDFLDSWEILCKDNEFQNRLDEIRSKEEKSIINHAMNKSESTGYRKPFNGETFSDYAKYVKSITSKSM